MGVSFAQKPDNLDDSQVRQFIEKARASGMTESQIETAALKQGYTQSDIAKMREKISKVENTATKNTKTDDGQSSKIQSAEGIQRNPTPPAQENPVVVTEKKSEIFGASLFNNASLSFEPNLRIATPKNYILGADDELVLDIVGLAQVTYKLKVSPEGTVRVENIPPTYVSGLTIEQAADRVISKLRARYEGLNVPGSGLYAQVTLGAVKSIKVIITGEVTRPGTYTLSSLATVFNALYQAGGPSKNGSFRDIKVIRDNKVVRSLDLYDFMLNADQKDNIGLRDQDVIRIGYYQTRVELAGEIKTPNIFEVKKGETLQTILEFAGGFTDQAYTANITLKRNTNKELQIQDIGQESYKGFELKSGDKFMVGTILNRYENRVEIKGAVFRPGEFAIGTELKTVKDLIKKAEGLREDAFLARANIIREKENLDIENIAFDLGKLIKGEIADVPLKRQDVLTIKSLSELREKRNLQITGGVNKGGSFDYTEKMSVADLIVLAGGFTDAAIPNHIEIARRVKDDTLGLAAEQNIIKFIFDINQDLKLSNQDSKFELKPFDIVFVRTSPRYEVQALANITGEVYQQGSYPIKLREERITDLIRRSGGFRASAFAKGVKFSRKGIAVAIDIRSIVENPSQEANLLLENGDTLLVPRVNELVSISGNVLNANTVGYIKSFGLMDYISQAGGFTEKSWKKKVYVTYANGISERTKSFLFFKKYPKIEQGTNIYVPTKPENENNRRSPAETVAIASATASFAAVIITLVNLLKP